MTEDITKFLNLCSKIEGLKKRDSILENQRLEELIRLLTEHNFKLLKERGIYCSKEFIKYFFEVFFEYTNENGNEPYEDELVEEWRVHQYDAPPIVPVPESWDHSDTLSKICNRGYSDIKSEMIMDIWDKVNFSYEENSFTEHIIGAFNFFDTLEKRGFVVEKEKR